MSADLPLEPRPELTAAGEHAWVRLQPAWHVAFAAVIAFTAAWTVVDAHGTATVAAALALEGAFAVWYATAGLRAIRGSSSRWSTGYLVVACALFIAADAVYPGSGFLLFIVVPLCFMLLDLRRAAVAIIGLVLVSGASLLAAQGVSTDSVLSVGLSGLLTLVFSLLLGVYIDRIVAQSAQRAALIAELETTRSQLADLSREAGMLAERERLSREIHDTLAQGFTSLVMLLSAAAGELDSDPAAARHHVTLAEQTARENLAEARSLVAELTPHHLESATLGEAVTRLAQGLGRELAIPVHAAVTGPPRRLPPNTEVVLLRATQEALANVRRHAAARSLAVELDYSDTAVRLRVRDDGRGFDPPTVVAGYGLAGMRARVASVGGDLRLTSRPGGGTAVEIEVP